MLEKIPPNRQVYLLIAIGIGAGAGWYLNPGQGVWVGALAAAAIIVVLLSALGPGHWAAMAQAARSAADGVRPVKPLGAGPQESAAFDALDAIAQRLAAAEARAHSAERVQ